MCHVRGFFVPAFLLSIARQLNVVFWYHMKDPRPKTGGTSHVRNPPLASPSRVSSGPVQCPVSAMTLRSASRRLGATPHERGVQLTQAMRLLKSWEGGGTHGKLEEQPHAIADTPITEMRSPDAERDSLPIAGDA